MRKTMNKRILALALSVMMVLGLLLGVTPYAHAEEHTHTYEEGKYVTDAWFHYPLCDTCEIWGADHSAEFHSDSDSNCICDVCGYVMHQIDELTNQGENHEGYCSECEQTVTLEHVFDEDEYDSESHWSVCDCGATNGNAAHTYENNVWYTDAAYHYAQCDSCLYYNPVGIAHTLTGAEGEDKECSTCHYIAHNYAWDQKTWDVVDHWVKCSVCEEERWQRHSDGDDEDQKCDVCGFSMDCQHEGFMMHNDAEHWYSCEKCEADISNRVAHSFDNGNYYKVTDKHYPECDGCSYYLEAEGNAHVDENEDTYCDVCGYWIHDHDFGSDVWACDDGKHSPWCDLCYTYIEELGVACTDGNGDHWCDEKDGYMEWLCTDKDNNHICDAEGCETPLTELCTDNDSDHVCDTCEYDMRFLCSDGNNDWYCDTCGRNLCSHWFEDEPVSNNDGTHNGTCGQCSRAVTEDCWFNDQPVSNNDGTHSGTCGDCEAEIDEPCAVWEYNSDETGHTGKCSCGYEVLAKDYHTYEWYARSMTGHWLYCTVCDYEKWEAHTTPNVTCPVCEMKLSAYADVYVGGVGLKDGEYLDNSGNVSTTQPTGGYAYYKNGVLELNGYVYEGIGILWKEYDEDDVDYASIYATTDLILVLTGENSLKAVLPGKVAYESGDGIAAQQDLTIRGEGSLTIQAEDDGIQVELGDLTLESGTVSLGVSKSTAVIGDDGIDMAEGDLIIEDGTLNICSVGDGIEMDGGVTVVTDGTVTVVAEDCGLDCEGNVIISGGEVSITTKSDVGIWAKGNVVILDGTVNITATDSELGIGILAWEDIVVYGGTIDIDANYNGFSTHKNIAIYGGELTVNSVDVALRSDSEVIISGGYLTLTSSNEALVWAQKGITVENVLLPEGVAPVQDDEYGWWSIRSVSVSIVPCDNGGETVSYYTVIYKADGAAIDIQIVEHGKDAVLPSVPKKDGYVGKWDHDGINITANTEINAVYTAVSGSVPENLKPEDKTELEDTKKTLEEELKNDIYSEDEKKAIEDEIKRIDDALEVIGNVEAVEELIDKLPENITKNDEAAIKAADDAYNTLSDYEKSLVDEDAKKALDDAKAAFAELNKQADSSQDENDSSKEENTISDTTSPQTGDNSNLWLWVALLFVSGGAVITLTVVDRKRKTVKR